MYTRFLLSLVATLALATSLFAADALAVPNRLDVAKVGEWVLYTGMGGANQKQTIAKIEEKDGDRIFTITAEMIVEGQTIQSMSQDVSYNEAVRLNQAMAAEIGGEMSEVTEAVNGKELKMVLIDANDEGSNFKTYFSEAIPVTGLVKIVIDGEVLMEVADYGEE